MAAPLEPPLPPPGDLSGAFSGASWARGAAVVAGLTFASRVMGLVRIVVATGVLGITYLGNTYATANAVPNLLFEVFAGGALAAVVLPALSAPLARGKRAEMERVASAFATNVLVVLTPVVVAGLVLRGPLMALLTSGVTDAAVRAQERELGELLLLFFLPQIWLYGLGTVLTGVLHAHHRFAGPALAPLLSSVVVTLSYILYAFVEGSHARQLGEISGPGRMILGLGTTAGVATLSLSLFLPVRRLRLRWRPTLRIPDEARGITRRLLGSAVIAMVAQQVLLGVVLALANAVEGGVVAYQLAFTILAFPWAVLAVPVASASFPGLSEAAARSDTARFADRCAAATRTLGLVVFGGAAALFATAAPGGQLILALGLGGEGSTDTLIPTISAFAPGLIGYGAYALLTRAAYALGDGRSPSLAAVVGFGSAAVLDLACSVILEGAALIAGLAGAFSIGMIVAAGVLLLRLRRAAGPQAFAGVGVTALRGLASGGLSALAGSALARALPHGELLDSLTSLLAAGLAAVLTYLGAQYLFGDRELARVAGLLRLDSRGPA